MARTTQVLPVPNLPTRNERWPCCNVPRHGRADQLRSMPAEVLTWRVPAQASQPSTTHWPRCRRTRTARPAPPAECRRRARSRRGRSTRAGAGLGWRPAGSASSPAMIRTMARITSQKAPASGAPAVSSTIGAKWRRDRRAAAWPGGTPRCRCAMRDSACFLVGGAGAAGMAGKDHVDGDQQQEDAARRPQRRQGDAEEIEDAGCRERRTASRIAVATSDAARGDDPRVRRRCRSWSGRRR